MATKAPELVVASDEVVHTSPEGQVHCISMDELLALMQMELLDNNSSILPPGVRNEFRRGPFTIWAGEFGPTLRSLKWIAADSPVDYGKGTKYQRRLLALPYVIVLAVFQNGTLTGSNECFFRVAPLNSLEDQLHYPSLLNVSRFDPPDGKPLAWICTQHLNRQPIEQEKDQQQRMALGWQLLCRTLFVAGFNLSSEHHEANSWFTQNRSVDKRIETVERWEECSRENPLFMLEVPFLKTDLTLIEVVDRIFTNLGRPRAKPTADDLVRLIVNHSSSRKKPR